MHCILLTILWHHISVFVSALVHLSLAVIMLC